MPYQHVIRGYGWIPDKPSIRHPKYASKRDAAPPAGLPPSVNLMPTGALPPVYDQGQLGSCTANAIAAAIEFDLTKQKAPHVFRPSRLFIYWNERQMEGTTGQDCGAAISDGITSVNKLGVCEEYIWDYDINKFATRPPQAAFVRAKLYEALQYASIDNTNLTDIKTCLAAGFPVVFGFTVYDGFESQTVAQTGVLNLPGPSEQQVGGHAVLCVGYDDASQRVIVRNSWGDGWGQKGYFTMPYAYITNPDLADDAWTIRVVGAGK